VADIGDANTAHLAQVIPMIRPIDVWFDERNENGGLVRRLVFENVAGKYGPKAEFWWHISGPEQLPPLPVLDSLLVGPVLFAMMRGQDLVVHGAMSPGGLYNIGQLIEIRQSLSPERYPRRIEIRPDTVTVPRRTAEGASFAIAALSGGLDSTFTAVRHGRRLLGDASYHLRSLVMIRGFDAAPGQPDHFDEMRRRAEPLASFLGLPLHTVATNSKGDSSTWPQSAIPLTAAALAHFSGLCDTGVVSAGVTSGSPRFSISHPAVLEALCSNDYFRVVTDGSGFGRTDKIEALLPYPEALAGIKVCWEGPDPSRNCGRCNKCVVTRLNFLAAGIRDAPCFDSPIDLSHIADLHLPSMSSARDLFRFCWNEMAERGITGPEMDLLTRRLSRVPPDKVAYWLGRVQRAVKRRLPQPLKRALRRVSAGLG